MTEDDIEFLLRDLWDKSAVAARVTTTPRREIFCTAAAHALFEKFDLVACHDCVLREREIRRLSDVNTGFSHHIDSLNAEIARLGERVVELEGKLAHQEWLVERLSDAGSRESDEIKQRIAALFPDEYPKYSDDQVNFPGATGDDRCVGEHVPVTLVMQACSEIERLRALLGEPDPQT